MGPCCLTPLPAGKGFTSVAFQYFSVCGKYSGFARHPADWIQCNASQMYDPPHLEQAHPFGVPHDFGAQLKRALGADVELWPVVNFGNGYHGDGGRSIQQMVNNTASRQAFIRDLIAGAHSLQATGVSGPLAARTCTGVWPTFCASN